MDRKKKHGLSLTWDEIHEMIHAYVHQEIADYQMSAFLMAVWFQGMSLDETIALTDAMMHSSKTLDLSGLKGITCDKHSTGGVGDKTSLVLVPLVAACGGIVAKMSGRGLGHTGGTVDKLESIPGYQTTMGTDAFYEQVKKVHAAIIGQSDDFVVADQLLYALRDVTGTIDSIPLIASSILSKKLAAGSESYFARCEIWRRGIHENKRRGTATGRLHVCNRGVFSSKSPCNHFRYE